MHPYLRHLLIWWIGDQVKRITRFERLQMAIPVGKGDAMDRSAKVGWSAIREGRTILAHTEFNDRITVHGPWLIRYVVQHRRPTGRGKHRVPKRP